MVGEAVQQSPGQASQLELSHDNVRKTTADASAFTELKASIAAHGLLENLIAWSMGPGADGPARYAVIAGGRPRCRRWPPRARWTRTTPCPAT